MKSSRENPDSEENEKETRQNQREAFALQMQAKQERVDQDEMDEE